MKILRVLLSLIALILLVIGFAAASLYLFIEPNKLKPILVAQVKQRTGYQLQIPDKLGWAFYPRFSIQVDRLLVTAPQGTQPFADLHNVKIALPLSQLLKKKNNWHGNIFIEQLALGKVQMSNARIDLAWQQNGLQLKSLKSLLYGGVISGHLYGSEFNSLPQWRWLVELQGIQVQPLLEALEENSKLKLSGIANMKLQAMSQGKSSNEIVQHVNGDTAFDIHQGSVKGIDLNYLVVTADALMNKQDLTQTGDNAQTTFEILDGTAIIKDGIATTNNLNLVTPALLSKGQGSVNLWSQAIDLQMQVTTQRQLKTQWTIPILISGNLSEPNIRLDREAIEKWLAKQDIEKVKAKIQEKVNEILPKANEFLQKIFQ